MKKLTLFILILVATLSKAQEKQDEYPQDVEKKHEIKINALTLIALEWLDGSYEYLIDEESSFGTALTFGFSDITNLNFALTPFYRRYFSEKFAKGFFVEGFGMLFSEDSHEYITHISTSSTSYRKKPDASFALGVSVGGKFVSERGFSTEVFLGIGRNLSNNDSYDNSYDETVGRIGISLGYRF